MDMPRQDINVKISGKIGLLLLLLFLMVTTSSGRIPKQQNCPQCESPVDVVIDADTALLGELTVMAEGTGGTVRALNDGQGYLAQLPKDMLKILTRRGIAVRPPDGGKDNPIPKAGDECDDALVAEPGVTYVGTTTFSIPWKWYSFTPAETGFYTISLAGSNYDTTLSVFDGCGGTRIGFNDDFGWELTSQLTLPMEGGHTYYILIEGFWGSYGSYSLHIEQYFPTPGESCIVPIETQIETLYEGELTNEMPEIWYSFTPASSGYYVMDLDNSQFDTILAVYGHCGTYALGYSDHSNDFQSRLSMYMYEGTPYLIQISTWWELGPYNFIVTPVTEPVPHDTVANASAVSLGQAVSGCTDAATSSLTASSCGYYDNRDVWHSYSPAASGFVQVTLEGHDFDTCLSVFEEDSGTELACNDDQTDCTFNSGLSMEMVQGKTYLIRVAGYYGGTGHYTLALDPIIQSPPEAPQAPNPADKTEHVSADVVLSWDNWAVPTTNQRARQVRANGKPSGGMAPKGIYGRDDRLDEYQITDPDILTAGDGTVILMPYWALEESVRQGYLLADTTTLAEYVNWAYGGTLCADEPFQNQPAPGWCSGFLVAPDLIVTAGHCVGCGDDIKDMVAVFGFVMEDPNTAVTTFSPENVYFCQEQVAGQYGRPDWSLVRLDRPVTGHLPLRLRQTGIIAEQQGVMVAGHPVGLPRKYDMGGTVKDNWQRSYFTANTDTFGGNSGSAVFNLDTLEVEGILVWGSNGDFVYDDNDCLRADACADSGCPMWEYATRISLLKDAVTSYDVFLGLDPDNMAKVDSGWGAPQYNAENLQGGQTYYWQVISRNAAGQTTGPIWSFTTAP